MTLKVHHLRPAPGAKTAKTRVGRGEGSKGKTAGRGTKGTKARYQVPTASRAGRCRCTCGCRSCKGLQEPVPHRVPGRQPRPARDLYPQGGEVTGRGPGRPRARSARASWSRCSAPVRPA